MSRSGRNGAAVAAASRIPPLWLERKITHSIGQKKQKQVLRLRDAISMTAHGTSALAASGGDRQRRSAMYGVGLSTAITIHAALVAHVLRKKKRMRQGSAAAGHKSLYYRSQRLIAGAVSLGRLEADPAEIADCAAEALVVTAA